MMVLLMTVATSVINMQKKDNRIVVVHKQNGGLSDARNKGAEIANGEYITFIDSDDYVTDTYVEYLYSLIEKYHTRMSLCTHTVVFENGKKYRIWKWWR